MIIRIVKMTFHSEHVNKFMKLFNENKNHIQSFKGCKQVQLLNDINDKNIFFTYSHWDDAESLEHYRQSDLFNTVWARTKILFADKPQAWSLEPA